MTALAAAYTAQSRSVDHGTFMQCGLDHISRLAFLGLGEVRIAHGIAMAASSAAGLNGIRSKPLSRRKGLASRPAALGVMNTLPLVGRGVQGPSQIVGGPGGIDALLGSRIDIDWSQAGHEGMRSAPARNTTG